MPPGVPITLAEETRRDSSGFFGGFFGKTRVFCPKSLALDFLFRAI